MINRVFYLYNKKLGLTVPFNPGAGLAVRGVFVSIFSGLALLVITFQILENHAVPADIRIFVYAGAALLIMCSIIGVYRGFLFYKEHCFRHGAKDTLHLMSLMDDCLRRDCSRLSQQVKQEDSAGLSTMHAMLQAKLEDILNSDCRTLGDIQARYRKLGLKKQKKPGFSMLFNTPEEYEQSTVPREFEIISEAVARNYYQLEPEFNDLKASRMRLFTAMGDYPSFFRPSEKSIRSILNRYRYNPPGPIKAQKIVFAVKLIGYFEGSGCSNLPHSKLKNDLAYLAKKRIPLISRLLEEYESAWKNFVDSYDEMKALPKDLDIR
ncbi:MAG: hypothetical protein DRH32_04760 [Deltaproteobacteria bacterium]|nr:MAG: hypothetical protein DRH32_04760 [Deltaproteobacteria bacterium]